MPLPTSEIIREYLNTNRDFFKHTNIGMSAGLNKNNMSLFLKGRYVLSPVQELAIMEIIKSFQFTKNKKVKWKLQ